MLTVHRDSRRNRREPEPADPFRLLTEMLGWPRSSYEARDASRAMMAPAFDVKEREDAYEIIADLPGVEEDDVDVTLTGNRLTVSGSREWSNEQEGERYHSVERQYGSFSRSFTLPEGTDLENIEADLSDGVLTLSVPKAEETKPKKIAFNTRKIDRQLS